MNTENKKAVTGEGNAPRTRIRKPNGEGYMTVDEFRNRIRKLCGLRPVEEHAEALAEALRKAQQDVNWMLNNRQFLNGDVFDYIEATLIAYEESKQ